jgi:exopolyphosphatase/pppGpp-phosphohydrolase
MTPRQRAALPGVTAARARQMVAGAIVADIATAQLGVDHVEICPWALREGILLRRLSPLLTSDSLAQIKLIQAAADPDVAILDQHRASRPA